MALFVVKLFQNYGCHALLVGDIATVMETLQTKLASTEHQAF